MVKATLPINNCAEISHGDLVCQRATCSLQHRFSVGFQPFDAKADSKAELSASQAAAILRKVLDADAARQAEASIKSLTLSPSVQAKKAVHAVVCETLRNLELLKHLLTVSELLINHPRLTEEAAYVLLFDLLLGQGLKPQGPAERAVLAAQDSLRTHLAQSCTELTAHPTSRGQQQLPRFARVNLLKMTVQEALSWLQCQLPSDQVGLSVSPSLSSYASSLPVNFWSCG